MQKIVLYPSEVMVFALWSRTISNEPFFVSGAINSLPTLFPIDLSHTCGTDSRANLSNPYALITLTLSKWLKCITEYICISYNLYIVIVHISRPKGESIKSEPQWTSTRALLCSFLLFLQCELGS